MPRFDINRRLFEAEEQDLFHDLQAGKYHNKDQTVDWGFNLFKGPDHEMNIEDLKDHICRVLSVYAPLVFSFSSCLVRKKNKVNLLL